MILTVSKQLKRVSNSVTHQRHLSYCFLPVAETIQNRQMWGVSDCLNLRVRWVGVCMRSSRFMLLSILLHRVSSLITRSAYGEAQGCPMQGQQCYRHLLTRYLIFENVLIFYGNILESTGVTWCSVFIQVALTVAYSPPYIYYELLVHVHAHMHAHIATCTHTWQLSGQKQL